MLKKVISLLLIFTSISFAQLFESGTRIVTGGGSSAYYFVGKTGELTITVNLWGFVRNPGRYEVPSSTDLVQLISYGGGPLKEAKLKDVKIIRNVREDSTIVEKVIKINVEKIIEDGEPSPILLPGDTVVVPGGSIDVIKDILAILRDIGLAAGGIAAIISVFRR
ncbi:polysaccharide export outer membrane protein [Candidatus Kryptonium thompsonii]|uniref:Polysaccharide export outer membrane protein n=2 Tax=Candidatus Kryptonium thompsonii TaxID=1633631 RepID=A0A0P1L6A6_9BACT|nr:SLBB domain-containing protein [Candidatus Kryptonium thompsoni]CUS76406.1 polysaccharide export outer membrane protein [Candidatus Kryptonium thompsoni]CUS78546.1 polysaccharide export outer membrane protein [Candidatus Kryptonium thompsoni]CUS81282.1 polysaccharide export outer membrane protein [Candidatus Kryptonium thompsoni]CUS84434.1 polysaccharide export outer membrane protein [Candidatus Kryptonium thompsoni]CUS91213.1 polysaccharide export outer membrane protein [Candidatus Krypton